MVVVDGWVVVVVDDGTNTPGMPPDPVAGVPDVVVLFGG